MLSVENGAVTLFTCSCPRIEKYLLSFPDLRSLELHSSALTPFASSSSVLRKACEFIRTALRVFSIFRTIMIESHTGTSR